jgi:malate synthase
MPQCALGSLYDALYGTDAIPEEGGAERSNGYNPVRGARVVAWARRFLDAAVPLAEGSWADCAALTVAGGKLAPRLADPDCFAGYRGDPASLDAVLLRHHGLHIEIVVDRKSLIGTGDAAGIADLVLEAALTTIQDCEDSVATVDAADKVLAYRNWLGLMKGDLSERSAKAAPALPRRLNPDRLYTAPDGGELVLPAAL